MVLLSFTWGAWLNQTIRDWHSRSVTLSNAKGLGVRFFAALLRNKTLGSDRLGEEREAQSRRGALEVTDRPLTEVLVIGLLTLWLIRSAMFEHMIENTRQLMRSGRGRLRGAFARPQPAVITAQGRLRAPHATILCSIGVQNQTQKRAAAAPFATPVLACLGMSGEDSTSPFLPPRLAPALWTTQNDKAEGARGTVYECHVVRFRYTAKRQAAYSIPMKDKTGERVV